MAIQTTTIDAVIESSQRGHPRYEQWTIFQSKTPDDPASVVEFLAVYAGEHDSEEDWAQNDREDRGESQSGPQFNQFVSSSFHPVQGTHWALLSSRFGYPDQGFDTFFIYKRVP